MSNKARVTISYSDGGIENDRKGRPNDSFSLNTLMHPMDAAKVMTYAMQLQTYRLSHPELEMIIDEAASIKDDDLDKIHKSLTKAEKGKK